MQNLSPGVKKGTYYKRDMIIEMDGIKGEGVVVLPVRTSYNINVKARGRLDMLIFETCHRVIERQNAWTKKKRRIWGQKKNETSIPYNPNPGMENGMFSCPVRIGGYDINGQHSWAFIDFMDPKNKLNGYVRCAGQNRNTEGVDVCQAKAGTIQALEFQVPVFTSEKGNCGALQSKNRRHFRFVMKKGECVYRFKEDGPAGREFRLTTIGYESILIRED